MLSGKGNENSDKTIIGLIIKKSNFARVAHFFCTFLCRCFARLQRETSRNFLFTRFMEEMSCVTLFLFNFFFHCRSFSPRWPLEFLILSPPLQNFHVVFPTTTTKKCLSVALFLVKLCWPVPYFLFFYVFLFLCIPN